MASPKLKPVSEREMLRLGEVADLLGVPYRALQQRVTKDEAERRKLFPHSQVYDGYLLVPKCDVAYFGTAHERRPSVPALQAWSVLEGGTEA